MENIPRDTIILLAADKMLCGSSGGEGRGGGDAKCKPILLRRNDLREIRDSLTVKADDERLIGSSAVPWKQVC